MSADTKSPERAHAKTSAHDAHGARSAHLLRIVIALVALSACAAFAIQAWFAYGFARYVWQLPQTLSLAVPVANDLYIVTLMVVSYLLRSADSRVRRYVWCVLGLGIGAQIGAAWSFENWRSTGAHSGVSFAALIPAALLAAALHSLIIAARHMPSDEQGHETGQPHTEPQEPPAQTPAGPARRVATAVERAAGRAAVTERPVRVEVPPAPTSGRRTSKGDDSAIATVRKLVAGGMTCRAAAVQVGRSKRWVEIQTRDIRAGRDVTQGDTGAGEMQEPAIAPNGALSPKGIGAESVASHPDVAGRDTPKVMPARAPSVQFQL
jgi:hypothetical protein